MVSLIAQRAEVRYDAAVVTPPEIAIMIEDMGYDATVQEDHKSSEEDVLTLIVSYDQ